MSIQLSPQIQVTFSFKTCKCTFFELTQFGSSSTEKINDDKFTFNLGFRFDLDEIKKTAVLSVNSTLAGLKDPSQIIAKIDTINEFLIANFNEAITKNIDGLLAIPDPVLAAMISVSISSVRGMYVIKLQDTIFNNAVLPLFDPNSLIPKKPAPFVA